MMKYIQTCNIVVMWTGGDVEVYKAIVSHAVTIMYINQECLMTPIKTTQP